MKLFEVFSLSLYTEKVRNLGLFENVTIRWMFLYHRQQQKENEENVTVRSF